MDGPVEWEAEQRAVVECWRGVEEEGKCAAQRGSGGGVIGVSRRGGSRTLG